MFQNPLYNLFLHKNSLAKFSVEERTFADGSERNYLIIKNNIQGAATNHEHQQELRLGGVNYRVLDSHLTVPRLQDRQEGFFSAYHHTLDLADAQRNRFTIHIYFDRFDHYCTNPRPVIKAVPSNALKPLSDDDLNQIFSRFVVSTNSKIQFIRALQRTATVNLRNMLSQMQKTTTQEITTHGLGSKQHLASLESQIPFLQRIQEYELPSNKSFAGQRDSAGFSLPATASHLAGLKKAIAELKKVTPATPTTPGTPGTPASPTVDQQVDTTTAAQSSPIVEASPAVRTQEKQAAAKALAEEQLRQEQATYQKFVDDYGQALVQFKSAITSNSNTVERKALRHLCLLFSQVAAIQETHGVDPRALTNLHLEAQQTLQSYCNEFSVDAFRGKLAVLLDLKLDNFLTEETVANLAMLAITAGDHQALGSLLEKFDLPVLQTVRNPREPAPTIVMNSNAGAAATSSATVSPQHALLEWCVELNQPKCFGLLLRHGHSLEHFYHPASMLRQVLSDVFTGEPFIKELIGLRGAAANNVESLRKREFAILEQQLAAPELQGDQKQLQLLHQQMLHIKHIDDANVAIKQLLAREHLSGAALQLASRAYTETTNHIASQIPKELVQLLRQDLEFHELLAEQAHASLTLFHNLAAQPGLIAKALKLTRGLSAIAEDGGPLPQLNRAMVLASLRFSIAKDLLVAQYATYILGFSEKGDATFKPSAKKQVAAYNRERIRIHGEFTRIIETEYKNTRHDLANGLLQMLDNNGVWQGYIDRFTDLMATYLDADRAPAAASGNPVAPAAASSPTARRAPRP